MGSDLTGAFRTHQQYLEAFARIATDGQHMAEAYRSLHAKFASSDQYRQLISEVRQVPHVRRALESAWGTELLLLLGHRLLKSDEVIRLSNNWNVIQAYYALYHATQAVLLARGFQRPDSHPKTQRMFSNFWGQLPIEFAPWSMSTGHDGHLPSAMQIQPSLHVWKTVNATTCWTIACKALSTTRTDAFDERCKVAREEKRRALRKVWREKEAVRISRGQKHRQESTFRLPLLTPDEKNRVQLSTRRHTLIDYLYRLRIRSNYVDSAMFTEGPENEEQSSSVQLSLLKIVSMSLLASELALSGTPNGKRLLTEWACKWIGVNVPKNMRIGIANRHEYWCSDN